MGTRAAIYARQSNTAEGSQSLAIQVDACRLIAKRFELSVEYELVEPPSTSAYKNRGRTRPRFLELLGLIQDGQIDCVVVYKTDRLSRGGGVGWAPLLEAIEAAGHDTNRFILTDGGWLTELELGFRAAFDREESTKIAARMSDVRAREARQGRPRPGLARGYGYERDCLTVRDTEADTIREAARRVLAGETLYSVVKDFNARVVPTVSGCPWSSTTLGSLLRSARIAGLRAHHGVVVATGVWPAIIDAAEHYQLASVLSPRPGAPRKTAPRTFPLVGLLFCGKCGEKLRSVVKVGGGRAYACRNGDNLHGCGGIKIKAEWVEGPVRDYVVSALSDPDLRDRIIAAIPVSGDGGRDGLLGELRSIDASRRRLTDLGVEGAIPASEVKRKNVALDDEVSRIERRLADIPLVRTIAGLPIGFEALAEAWAARGITYQRLLIDLTVTRIVVQPRDPARSNQVADPRRLKWELRA